MKNLFLFITIYYIVSSVESGGEEVNYSFNLMAKRNKKENLKKRINLKRSNF